MKQVRLSVLALLTIGVAAPPTIAVADQAPKALVLPITGAAAGGFRFTGTVAVQRFVQINGEVFATGTVSGTVSGPTGTIGTSVLMPVAFPVHVGAGVTARVERERIHPAAFLSPDRGARVILAQATTCGVLHLDLGAVNLNLLGVVVTTTPVTIDINGDTGGALGNLVCTALATVNNVVGLVNVLNSVLSLVTGLVGGLTGGLGGAAI
jgi:hypothetical protein